MLFAGQNLFRLVAFNIYGVDVRCLYLVLQIMKDDEKQPGSVKNEGLSTITASKSYRMGS
ncbi:hypothetical protein N7465_006328 [Penicillium sp. CMV-2018d]|nr:hypothetical protein N7465_006328 [Penicillium sp. CMV-2018d]